MGSEGVCVDDAVCIGEGGREGGRERGVHIKKRIAITNAYT